MVNTRPAAGIIQTTSYRFTQTQTVIHLLQQQNPTIRGNVATLEVGLNNASF